MSASSPLLQRTAAGYVADAEILAKVEELAQEGHPRVTIAQRLGITRDTFRDLCRRQPEVDEALARGLGLLEVETTNLLLAQAREGNVTAMIWLEKTRLGKTESGPRDGSASQINVQINLPAAMSREQYEQTLGVVDATETPQDKGSKQ